MNYQDWPIEEFERRFYKEISIEGYRILVPATKLGRGIISDGEKGKREAARVVLSNPDVLAKVRASRLDAMMRLKETTQALVDRTTEREDKILYMQSLIQVNTELASLPTSGEATNEECDIYANEHRAEDDIFIGWLKAVYIPIADCPPIEKIYKYIPIYIIMETQGFFGESVSAPEEKSAETPKPSAEENSEVRAVG
jgi:hypothetical protein